jgi:lipopolysaccharide transport system permease protein
MSTDLRVYEPAKSRLVDINWRELWEYRELLYFLTWRDVKVRYKQAALGVAWALLQPVFTMLVFSLIFGSLAKLDSEGIPYPVFTFVALLPWQLFAGSLGRAGTSLVSNSSLLTKVYFPRLIIPISAVGASLVDFGVSFLVLIALMLGYGIPVTWAVLTLPFFVLMAVATALAVGLWLSALNVQYRDVQYLLSFIIQAWMYASPVAYSAQIVPEGIGRVLYGLNPLAGVIQGFRWALLGAQPPDALFLASLAVVIVLLVSGLAYFKRMEGNFADIV